MIIANRETKIYMLANKHVSENCYINIFIPFVTSSKENLIVFIASTKKVNHAESHHTIIVTLLHFIARSRSIITFAPRGEGGVY